MFSPLPSHFAQHGTPTRIIQNDIDVIFFYPINADYGGGNNEYRNIPTDGRARSALEENLATFYGQSIGTWQGDTLAIDSIHFDDSTWLGRGGLIHSGSMHILEKLTRVGNEIRYEMTIEDPEKVWSKQQLRDREQFSLSFNNGEHFWRSRRTCAHAEEICPVKLG